MMQGMSELSRWFKQWYEMFGLAQPVVRGGSRPDIPAKASESSLSL